MHTPYLSGPAAFVGLSSFRALNYLCCGKLKSRTLPVALSFIGDPLGAFSELNKKPEKIKINQHFCLVNYPAAILKYTGWKIN